MLRNKDIQKIEEIQTGFNPARFNSEKLTGILKAMKLTDSFSEFNYLKASGYSFKWVLSLLIVMVVTAHNTVLSSLSSLCEHRIPIGKDVFYRLKNKEHICWRRILWHIGMKFIGVTESNRLAEEVQKPHYLIFDDTTVEKSGKKMEFLGRVWDHVKQCSVLGFKILVMLYWDGKSSVPLDFSIHREKGKRETCPYGMSKKDLRRQYSKKRVKESESCKRIKELDTNKISMMLKMFYSAVYRCLKIDYVLVDSWFTCDALIQAVVGAGIDLIGMYKIAKTKFFSRRGKRGAWKVLLTTDTSLSFIRLIEHYQVRWTIEVFNKEAKGLLNLGGSQSSNFDAQIADTTISMIAYILLAFRFRYEHYESMGALYRSMNAECLRLRLDKRLWELFLEAVRIITQVLDIDADDLLGRILTNSDAELLLNLFMEHQLQEAC